MVNFDSSLYLKFSLDNLLEMSKLNSDSVIKKLKELVGDDFKINYGDIKCHKDDKKVSDSYLEFPIVTKCINEEGLLFTHCKINYFGDICLTGVVNKRNSRVKLDVGSVLGSYKLMLYLNDGKDDKSNGLYYAYALSSIHYGNKNCYVSYFDNEVLDILSGVHSIADFYDIIEDENALMARGFSQTSYKQFGCFDDDDNDISKKVFTNSINNFSASKFIEQANEIMNSDVVVYKKTINDNKE